MPWGWNKFYGKYNERFNKSLRDKYTNKGNIYIDDQNFFIGILEKITGRRFDYGEQVPDYYKEYKTTTFGLDF